MPHTLRSATLALVAILTLASSLLAAEPLRYRITVEAKHASKNVPVRVEVAGSPELAKMRYAELKSSDGLKLDAQLTAPSLPSVAGSEAPADAREIHFIVPEVAEGKTLTFEATLSEEAPSTIGQFAWHDEAGKYNELKFGDRPILRYMYESLDESTKPRREETFKPYHHVYNPQGTAILTKGPGGLFQHHRGLYFGFNRISYADGKKKADVWHCTGTAYQSHDKTINSEVGPVLGRHLVEIGWHGEKQEEFAKERREMTVYRQPLVDGQPAGTLIEFASQVSTSTGGDIQLDGDPQHSGFHWRSSQEVAEKTKGKTYYIRVDGVGKPGEYRNWPDKKDQVNFPWKGMSIVVGDQRYTVANLDRPDNPKESRFSERDYGRFGSYFAYKITPEKPLKVNYRIWVQEGEMTPEQIAALDLDFVEPPKVTATKL